jgi:hypothetical protein
MPFLTDWLFLHVTVRNLNLSLDQSLSTWHQVQRAVEITENGETDPTWHYAFGRLGVKWADECAARDKAVALRFAWIGACICTQQEWEPAFRRQVCVTATV